MSRNVAEYFSSFRPSLRAHLKFGFSSRWYCLQGAVLMIPETTLLPAHSKMTDGLNLNYVQVHMSTCARGSRPQTYQSN